MNSALSAETDREVLPWLQLAEDLRLLSLDVELSMPQICVMGDQSSGKSSVLEALSGIPFPRGSGLVTRCPIRMVMKRSRNGAKWSALVSTSVDSRQTTASNVNELNILIDRKMQDLCQAGNNFSTESVIVDLVSPDACDLTVVDLPGIIRTVTAGQNVDSIRQVNALIKSFLMDKRTIILAIVPANQDIATIDILERAQSVDPTGQRTIGVVTKADLVGPGSEDEVLAVVNNIRKPLALGYVIVKNRSQKDITENVSTQQARENEVAFFATHPQFRRCPSHLSGITNLSRKLTLLLVQRIKQELAPMRQTVDKLVGDVKSEMKLLPSRLLSTATVSDRQKLFVSTVQTFVRHMSDSVRGEYRERLLVRNEGLRLFSQAVQQFESFKQQIHETAPLFRDEAFIATLATHVEQFRGRELPGFLSAQAFYMSVAQCVEKWEQPAKLLVQQLQIQAQEVVEGVAAKLLAAYPQLQYAIREVASSVLQTAVQQAQARLEEEIRREKEPFTLNDFLQQWVNKLRYDRFAQAVDDALATAQSPVNNWNGIREELYNYLRQWYRANHAISTSASAQEMGAILEAYWHLSAQRFVDNCCMACDSVLLTSLPDALQDALFPLIHEDEKLVEFFTASQELVAKRQVLDKKRERLLQAADRLTAATMGTLTTAVSTFTATALERLV